MDRNTGNQLDILQLDKEFNLNSLLNTIPGGVAIFKCGKRVECQYFNDGFAKLSGRNREEVEELNKNGNLLQTVIAPADKDRFLREMNRCIITGKPINMTYRYLIKNKGLAWLHIMGTKYREEDGCPVYYCVFTNPTDETALYRNVVEDSANGVFVADRKTRRILYMNDGIRKLFGIPQKRLKNRILNSDPLPADYTFLTQEEVLSLQKDSYHEFHVVWRDKLYLGINAKAISWNGLDAYIMYFTDETAEHKHQEELQKLINEVPTGIGIYEIQNGVLSQAYLNDAYYEMLGIAREERTQYTGKNTMQSVHPDDVGIIQEAIQSILRGKDRTNIQFRVTQKANTWIWWSMSVSVVERKEDYVKIYTAFSDCTEMMRTQQRYKEQIRLKDVMAQDALAVSSYNLTRNRITEVKTKSPLVTDVLGLETVDETVRAIRNNTANEEEKSKFAQVYDCKTMLQTYEKGISHIEIRHHLRNDSRWMQTSFDMIRSPYTGDVEAMAILRDITEIVRSELVVKRLLDVDYEAIMLIDATTGAAFPFHESDTDKSINEMIEMQGYYADNIKGVEDFLKKYVAEEDMDRALKENHFLYIKERLETTPMHESLYAFQIKGKKLHKRAMYAYLEENKEFILCAIQDVTDTYEVEERQKNELEDALRKVEDANHSKTEFFARMSHDMRTPMNGIMGLAELSAEEKNADVLRKNMSKVRESGEYLLSLINDTLDFQRIESGKMKLNKQIVYTKTVFDAMVDMVRPAMEEKEIQFQIINHNVDMEWYVAVDPVRIKQIIVNLLSNPVKFTPRGGFITLELQNISREGMISRNCIRITDTGIGISEEFMKNQLFHPFAQEQNEVISQYAGSGLGLSIVKSLVELLGGKIEVTSKAGIGTTFAVYLDFERVDQEEAKRQLETNKEKKYVVEEQLKGKRILLVEDHPLNARIGQKLLEKVGCIVTWAEDGQKAVTIFSASKVNEFDAILMDIRMPVMNGLESTETIRALARADAGTVPIIAMTANAYDEDVKKSLAAGMNAHLGKPIDTSKLYETLVRFVCKE